MSRRRTSPGARPGPKTSSRDRQDPPWIREVDETAPDDSMAHVSRPLTGRDRRLLRGLAHGLRPIVRLGKGGLSPAVLRQIDKALADHELIKVHLDGDRAERAATSARIAESANCEQVGAVGGVVILYRRQPDPDKRRIALGG